MTNPSPTGDDTAGFLLARSGGLFFIAASGGLIVRPFLLRWLCYPAIIARWARDSRALVDGLRRETGYQSLHDIRLVITRFPFEPSVWSLCRTFPLMTGRVPVELLYRDRRFGPSAGIAL